MSCITRIIRAMDATRATDAEFATHANVSHRRVSAWRAMFRAENTGEAFEGAYAYPSERDVSHVEDVAARMLRSSLASIRPDDVVCVALPSSVADGLRLALARAS